LNAQVRVYLNGEPLPADDLLQSRLAVPADGTYELKVIGVNGLSDRAEFTVISQSLF